MMAPRRGPIRWLIRLLPLEIRESHGEEMAQVLRQGRRDAGAGARRGARFWLDALLDVLRAAPRQHLDALRGDLRFAWRSFTARPAFGITAAFILALGTGATAALFTIVNAVLLRPLPYADPDRLGLVWARPEAGDRVWLSPPEIDDIAQRAATVDSVAGLTDLRLALTGAGEPEELQVVAASASLFPMLGVAAHVGRVFEPYEDVGNGPQVVLLGDGLWRRRFGGAFDVVGRTVTLDGRAYTVVGVLPPSFNVLPPSSVFPLRVDAWVPLQSHLQTRARDVRFVHALVRVAPGVPFAHARDELAAIGAAISREHAADYRRRTWSFALVPLQQDVLRGVRPALLLLFAIAMLVLVSASANVSALLVARGESRRREMAIRIALGASRARIVRQLFTEGWALAAAGGALALVFVAAAPLAASLPALRSLPRFSEIEADWRVLGFMLMVSLAAAAVFAAAPAVDVPVCGRGPGEDPLRTATRGRHTRRVLRGVAIMQIAVASLVLALALGLTRHLGGLLTTSPGFASERLLTFRVSLGHSYTSAAAVSAFFDEVVGRVNTVPGVEAAAAVSQLPFSGAVLGSSFTAAAGTSGDVPRVDADLRGVTAEYFEAMRITLLEGRAFTSDDRLSTRPVAVVDQLFARRMWPHGSAIGRTFEWLRQPGVAIEVVGVVAPVRHRGYRDPARETVYRPHTQYPRPSMYVVARAAGDPGSLARDAAAAVHAIDPSQPLADLMTMEQRAGAVLAEPAFGAGLSMGLAALGVLLAAAGVYGLQAFLVAARTRELGIRLALGASSRQLATLVLRDAGTTAAIGLLVGIPAAALVSRAVPLVASRGAVIDLPLAVGTAVVVLAAAVIACWRPARGAARVNPAVAFRGE